MVTPTAAIASNLVDLDDDMLTAVLLGLPAPRRREWIFVALTCKALHKAVLRASVVDTIEQQRARGLPCGRHNVPVEVMFPSEHRFATSIAGLMATPLRIVYAKECLRPGAPPMHCVGTLLETSAPSRVRDQFFRVLDHHIGQLPPQPTDRAIRTRNRAERLAAYWLTTRALYHMIRLAPLHTLRAAFFDVLGGGVHCSLDLTLRHHRCLVFFAAAHGRIDVLDRLVHRDPGRALAYDFDAGLLLVLKPWEDNAWVSTNGIVACSPHAEPDRGRDVQLLLARPAALHNQATVLTWLAATQSALRIRFAAMRTRTIVHRSPLLSTIEVVGISLGIRASGVAADGTCLYGNAQSMDTSATHGVQASTAGRLCSNWRALRLLFSEATTGASIAVLNLMWMQLVQSTTPQASLVPDETASFSQANLQEAELRFAVIVGMLLSLLAKPQRGTIVRWVVQKCHEYYEMLQSMSRRILRPSAVNEHAWNPGVFDLEDLLYVAFGTDSRLLGYVMDAFDICGEEQQLRERLVGPGDAERTEWLLDELAHVDMLVKEHANDDSAPASLPATLNTYNVDTGRGWLARSMAGYMSTNGDGGGGGFFLRTDLDPCRWTRTDTLCRHLLRLAYQLNGVREISAPLFYETYETVASRFASRTTPCAFVDLPETYVFGSRASECANFVPEHGLLGYTPLQLGLVTVLKRWLLHVLDNFDVHDPDAILRDRYEDWTRAMTEVPEASYSAFTDTCLRLLRTDDATSESQQHLLEARREVLGGLVAALIVSLCHLPWSNSPSPRLRWRCTWVVAYCQLAAEHKLVQPDCMYEQRILAAASRPPPLAEAAKRALRRLPVQKQETEVLRGANLRVS
jgi:hypothetical protein